MRVVRVQRLLKTLNKSIPKEVKDGLQTFQRTTGNAYEVGEDLYLGHLKRGEEPPRDFIALLMLAAQVRAVFGDDLGSIYQTIYREREKQNA
jgi:hypothetical protein